MISLGWFADFVKQQSYLLVCADKMVSTYAKQYFLEGISTDITSYLKFISELLNCSFPDEAQEAEAIQVINAILDLREQQSVQTPAVMCKIYFTTAMLQFILGDMPKVSYRS